MQSPRLSGRRRRIPMNPAGAFDILCFRPSLPILLKHAGHAIQQQQTASKIMKIAFRDRSRSNGRRFRGSGW